MAVNQVCIGSCTNSSYKDMMTVAAIMKGKTVSRDVSLGIAAGSRQVLSMLSQKGALTDMIVSGARIMESACGFCIGNHYSPKSAGVSIRTSNRNFEGRSGTKDAQVYLTSPEVAAVAAITGKFTDPRKAGMPYPKIEEPRQFSIDDSMLDFDYVCRRTVPSVAAIVNPGREGIHKAFFGTKEILLPIYPTLQAASAKHPKADVLVNFASFRSAFASTMNE